MLYFTVTCFRSLVEALNLSCPLNTFRSISSSCPLKMDLKVMKIKEHETFRARVIKVSGVAECVNLCVRERLCASACERVSPLSFLHPLHHSLIAATVRWAVCKHRRTRWPWPYCSLSHVHNRTGEAHARVLYVFTHETAL